MSFPPAAGAGLGAHPPALSSQVTILYNHQAPFILAGKRKERTQHRASFRQQGTDAKPCLTMTVLTYQQAVGFPESGCPEASVGQALLSGSPAQKAQMGAALPISGAIVAVPGWHAALRRALAAP